MLQIHFMGGYTSVTLCLTSTSSEVVETDPFLSFKRNSKKSITSAMVFAAYCAGNMAGPQFIYANEKPRYQSGAYAMSESLLSCFFSFPSSISDH